MEIKTRDQIELNMFLYRVVVAADRESWIEETIVKSLPTKKEYGDGEFFMWAMDVKIDGIHNQEQSITDMGIDQTPQYNLHATFTTRTEAINYQHTIEINYEGEDKKFLEFGDDLYKVDESVDPNELIPFDFNTGEMSLDLKEMCVSWSTAMSDEAEEVNHDAEVYDKASTDNKAYEDAMKFID